MDRSRVFRLQADVVVVSATQVLAPGQLEVRDGRIVETTGRLDQRPDVTCEGYALLPGLVNPHTHLEFSDLTAPLPAGKDFPQWIGCVLKQRAQRAGQADALLVEALRTGLAQSHHAGVAALADIVTPPWTPLNLARATNDADAASDALAGDANDASDAAESLDVEHRRWPEDLRQQFPLAQWQQLRSSFAPARRWPAVVACVEQLGLTPERSAAALAWREQLEQSPRASWPDCLQALGVSPHAPYSTPEPLWRRTLEDAARDNRLVAMHLAESRAEREWIDSGTGPFAELFSRLDVPPPARSPQLIAEACRALGRAAHALLIHGNYLNALELDAIAQHRQNLSVVYCPRTHRHFDHAPYPLSEFAARGIRVVFGTDSRSSNPDLNLWQEARTALALHAGLRPSEALAAISNEAARAIGLAARFGTLEPGRIAAINAVPLAGFRRRPAARLNAPSTIEELLSACFAASEHPLRLV